MMSYQKLYDLCHEAGLAAGNAHTPEPMVIRDSRSGQVFREAEGLCGFAEVVMPGNQSLGRAWKKLGIVDSHYPKGLSLWVHQFNQSYERKQAYARAFLDKLRELSPLDAQDVYVTSRLD